MHPGLIVAVPLVLQHQAEARLQRYAELFAPGLTAWEDPYAQQTYVELEDDEGEHRWCRCKRPINLWRGLAAHIAAGAEGEGQPYLEDGRALARAIGLGFQGSERVRVLNLDLDGTGYEPAAVVASLLGAVGPRLLVTSGSGRPGRYRVLMPIEPLSVREAHEHAGALLGALGYPPTKGGVEVYPASTNGRLPFGAGGCTRFEPSLRGPGVRHHPYDLLDRLMSLPAVDLATAAARGPTPVAPLRPRPVFEPSVEAERGRLSLEEHGRAARAVLALLGAPSPSPQASLSPSAPRSGPDPARVGAQLASLIAAPDPDPGQRAEKSTRFGRLWTEGVPGPGHRDEALYRLARDSLYRHRSQRRAVEQIQRWIASGGIARSEAARKGQTDRQIADVPRRVELVYETHPLGRPRPKHLSAREVLAVRELAERRSAVTGVPAARIGELLHRALPLFKACAHAGLAGGRVHCREWEKWGGHSYKAVRDAAGIFEALSGYVSQATLRELGRNPADAYARNWMAHFDFDAAPAAVPRRRLGGSYGAAKLAAELVGARAQRGAAARTEAGQAAARQAMTRPTSGISSGSHPVDTHIQTSPAPAAHTVLVEDPDRPIPGPDHSVATEWLPEIPSSSPSTGSREPPSLSRLCRQLPLGLPSLASRSAFPRRSPVSARRRLPRARDPDP
jgi:hypothetical protein